MSPVSEKKEDNISEEQSFDTQEKNTAASEQSRTPEENESRAEAAQGTAMRKRTQTGIRTVRRRRNQGRVRTAAGRKRTRIPVRRKRNDPRKKRNRMQKRPETAMPETGRISRKKKKINFLRKIKSRTKRINSRRK